MCYMYEQMIALVVHIYVIVFQANESQLKYYKNIAVFFIQLSYIVGDKIKQRMNREVTKICSLK